MSEVVPEGWFVEKIENITKDKKGAIKIGPFGSALSKKEMVSEGIKVYGQENVYRKNFSVGNYYITENKYASLKSCTLETGDVVVSMMGTVGASAVFPEKAKIGIMDSHLLRIQVNPQTITSEFLRRQISDYEWVSRQIDRMSQGGIMSGLNASIVKSVKVVLPPLSEQKKIASILTSVDEVIENTQKQIDKLQDLKKATMNELLTKGIGHTEFKDSELGRIPKSWEVKKLDNVTKRGSGHTPNKQTPSYWNGGIKWVSLADSNLLDNRLISETDKQISHEGLANSSAVLHPAGTVILSRDAGIGKSAVLNEEMAVSQHFMAWRNVGETDNWFLYFWMQASKAMFENIAMGSTIKTIGLGFFKDLKLALPPLKEQIEIGIKLNSLEDYIKVIEQKLSQTQSLKKSLMQDLLTGKKRVQVN